MTEDTAQFLLSPAGRALLTEADTLHQSRSDTLTALTRLRKTASPEQAVAAWEMAGLRRTQAKFGAHSDQMCFIREALEQASGGRAADYHAARFRKAGIKSVADLRGGLGRDALAFAEAGLRVALYETDPIRARFAEENARVCGFSDQVAVFCADATTAALNAEAVWFDPARRAGRRRVTDPEDYAPPLSFLHELQARGMADIGVKVSPTVDHSIAVDYGAELEFISDGGECKEALLWRGRLQTGPPLQATLLTGDGPQTLAGEPDVPGKARPAAAGRYLYEPDPAVIRAHLIGALATQIDAAPLDPHIAYLVGDRLHSTPFATAYEILDTFPYSRRKLQDALAARAVGRVIIKKRGFPQEPDAVRAQLKLRGPNEIIVVLARIGTDHQVFLCCLAAGQG